MTCSAVVTTTAQVPEFVPQLPALPPAAPGLPYVQAQWLNPSNPAEYGNLILCRVYGQQMPDADYYVGNAWQNGTQIENQQIDKSTIPNQVVQLPGYWIYQTPPIVAGSSMKFSVEACNSAGCSTSLSLTVPNLQPGNYGLAPTGVPTQAPTGTTALSVVNASTANLTLSFAPVTGADGYEIIDTDLGQTSYIAGLSSTDNPIKFTVLQSLLQSLGLKAGSTITLAVQAKNLIGDGPIGPPTKVTLTN